MSDDLLKGKVKRRDGGLFFVEAGEKNALTFPLKGRLEPLANNYVDKDIVFCPREDLNALPGKLIPIWGMNFPGGFVPKSFPECL